MKGSIRQRSPGSWEIRYEGPRGANGSRKQISRTVTGLRKDAERIRRELITKLDHGVYATNTKETVAEFLDRWLDIYVSTNTTPRTQMGYRWQIGKYVAPAIGGVRLRDLRPDHIQGMYSDLLKRGLSESSVNHIHRVLRKALNEAVRWESIVRNPTDAVTAPRPARQEIEVWDVTTLQNFLEGAQDHRYVDIYSVTVLTGLRRSEVLGLGWPAVDLERAVLRVVRTLQRINGQGLVESSPKTHRSRRSIALSETTVELLRDVRVRQMERRLAAGPLWNDSDYVFTQDNGKLVDPNSVTREFHDLVEELGLPHLTFHGLRHLHATLMMSEDVNPKVVMDLMGHADVSTTLRIYSHVMPGMQEKAAQQLADRIALRPRK